MADTGMSFSELRSFHSSQLRWKEICITTKNRYGVSGNKEEKSSECGGGYSYRDSSKVGSPCRNRFIYWHVNGEVLELVEVSLDLPLNGNCVRFRFQDSAIVGGVSVHESHGSVIILVTTVCSVHRLIFPHPNRLQKFDHTYLQTPDQAVPSVFTDASIVRAQDPANTYQIGGESVSSVTVHQTAAWLESDGHCLFAVASSAGSIILIRLPPFGVQGVVGVHELKSSSVMQRLWSGLVPSAIRGGLNAWDTILDVCIHPLANHMVVFAVCADHKLRLWSASSQECLTVLNLLDYMPDNLNPEKATLGGERHQLSKCVSGGGQLRLGVYLGFSDRCQFCVFEPIMSEGRYQLVNVAIVFGPQEDLCNFHLSPSHIWALWTTAEGDTVAKCAETTSDPSAPIRDWLPVVMEPSEPEELDMHSHVDPREAFIDHIFSSARFSVHVLLKALNLFRRSMDSSQMPDTLIPLQALKEEVSAAVEHEIHQAASEYEMTDEEFHQLQLQQWRRFYSGCVQYHQRGNKPLGLFTDNTTGMVALVKKESMSFIHSNPILEHIYLSPPELCNPENFASNPVFGEDEVLCRDVIVLCDCLKKLHVELSDEAVYYFEQDLYHSQSPTEVAANLTTSLLTQPGEGLAFGQEMERGLLFINNLLPAVDHLLQLLDVTLQTPDLPQLLMDEPGAEAARQLVASHLFASGYGVDILLESVKHFSATRLAISQDLLILITMAIQMGERVDLDLASCERLRCDMLGRCSFLVQSYYILKWLSTTEATATPSTIAETNMRQLEALELSESQTNSTVPKTGDDSHTLLEVFIRGAGGVKVREMMCQLVSVEDELSTVWNQALSPMVIITAQLLWPLSGEFVAAEFLLSQCQYLPLQEYVRLTKDWCRENTASLRFMLALCYLNSNEYEKALDCFLAAAHGVSTGETFLLNLLQEDAGDQSLLEVLYYLKVIAVMEQHGAADLVVSLAKTAISVAQPDDPNVATLWSKVFKHELELGHNQEAYNAMLANPEASRRKDCLRQFIVVLCERRQLQTLVSLPYRDRHVILEEEVVNILESRARSIDLSKHNYYDLLYSFHVHRGNWRKAGNIMYEYGMRLGQECPGVKGLQQQAKCYLAAVNALELVEERNAWIVKPLSDSTQGEENDVAAKRSSEGEPVEGWKRKVEVLGLEDIEKEYLLVHARLELLQHNPDPSHKTGPTPSAEETVVLLVNAGLFDSAVNLCKLFSIPLTPVFEALASRCVNLAENSASFMSGDNDYTGQAWKWLQLNDMPPANTTRDHCSTDHAWRLLHQYLEMYGDRYTCYHRCVAVRFLSQGFPLPHWLITAYKRLNAAQLLRLYLDYDCIEEAAHLAIEFIEAVMGKGREHFGLQDYLHCGASATWLPYTALDQLMMALRDMDSEPVYMQLATDLHLRLETYFATLKQVSEDTVASKQRAASTSGMFTSYMEGMET